MQFVEKFADWEIFWGEKNYLTFLSIQIAARKSESYTLNSVLLNAGTYLQAYHSTRVRYMFAPSPQITVYKRVRAK